MRKRLSIQHKITLYYAVIMIIFTLLCEGAIIGGSQVLIRAQSQKTIMRAVQDSFDVITMQNDKVIVPEDFDYYFLGSILVVYDSNGERVTGQGPAVLMNEPLENARLRSFSTSTEQYLLYDLYREYDAPEGVWVRGFYSITKASEELSFLFSVVFVGLPVLIAFALLVGSIFAARALAPSQKMAAALREINSGKDLKKRLPIREPMDELDAVAASINEMLDRLEQAFIYEQQFSFNVSHELKTPLAVILSECEIALSETQDASQQEGYLQIQSQAKRILSMCNQLLELHKHVSDEGSLDLELFDLSVLFQSLIEDMSETASAADVTLIPEIQPDIMFRGDETLMIRLLSNLMENGIKYRREDVQSFVRVRLYKKDRAVYLEVSDNGIGIRKEDYESIFNRFYKVEKSRNFLSNSFGLGLALVKWITQAHGGTIHVESTFGQATTFRCVFPDAGSTQLTIPSQG